MKINTFGKVHGRFFRPPNVVAILVSILERFLDLKMSVGIKGRFTNDLCFRDDRLFYSCVTSLRN